MYFLPITSFDLKSNTYLLYIAWRGGAVKAYFFTLCIYIEMYLSWYC
jgi:hypothetical protein